MRLSFLLGCLAVINILLSLSYQWFLFTTLGAGNETDALFAAMVVPQFLLAAVSGMLGTVFVPLLSTEATADFRQLAWTFTQGVGLVFGSVGVGLFLLAPFWIPLVVPGFDPSTTELAVGLTRIQLGGMVFLALTTPLQSSYHARNRFVWPELSPIFASATGLAFLIWKLPTLGVVAAAWALLIKYGLQTIFLLPGAGRYRRPDWHHPAVRAAWQRARPLLLGTTYYKTEFLVDRFLASFAAPGILSLLHFAQQLYAAGHQILGRAIGAPAIPRLAQDASRKDWVAFRYLTAQRVVWITTAASLVLAGIVVAAQPALSLLLGYGRFRPEDIATIRWLLIALGGMWVGWGAGKILAGAFHAKGDTTTPTRISMGVFTVGIALKLGGFALWGILGLAAATSLYHVVNTLVLMSTLNRHVHKAMTPSSGDFQTAVS
jgi:putative peptidoglycan lipid II flippase